MFHPSSYNYCKGEHRTPTPHETILRVFIEFIPLAVSGAKVNCTGTEKERDIVSLCLLHDAKPTLTEEKIQGDLTIFIEQITEDDHRYYCNKYLLGFLFLFIFGQSEGWKTCNTKQD